MGQTAQPRPRPAPAGDATRTAPATGAAPARPAGSGVTAGRSPLGVLARVARCGVVLLGAGVLVAGDIGAADHDSSRGAVTASTPAWSLRWAETQHEAAAARSEALALARAALDAAAAADALTRATPAQGPSVEVRAGHGATARVVGAVASEAPQLSPEQTASLATLTAAADVPALPEPLTPLPEDTASDEGADDAPTTDAHLEPVTVPGVDAGPTDDATSTPASDAAAVDALPGGATPEEPLTDAGAGTPAEGEAPAGSLTELASAVERLRLLVETAGAGSSEPGDAGSAALTHAVRTAAGEVFGLSLRVEAVAQGTSEPAAASRDVLLADLSTRTASAVAAADALVELQPVAAGERSVRAPGARPSGPRTVGGSPTVARLASTWSNGLIPADAMCEVAFDTRHRLQCDAADALADLNRAYREHFGTDLRLTDSYRTLEGQIAVKQAKGFLAATPGTSNHGWGLAIDVAGIGGLGQFDSPGYLWLKENAEAFGWHHPRGMEPGGSAPQEPWHWEFGTR